MRITVNGEYLIIGHPNKTILSSALENNLTIKHSCLNGKCSECKVRVLSGKYEMPNNQEGLDYHEIIKGYCLSCITKPITNLVLEDVKLIEGVLPKEKTLPAKIALLKFLSEDVVRMVLRIPLTKTFEFISGQYINLSIRGIKRSYSIASVSSDSYIELLIKNYNGGQFSNYLFNEAKINDLLIIEGPKGTYFLPKKIPNKVIFVSTGTGIAPNLSIIRNAVQEKRIKKSQIILIHGERYAKNHVYSLEKILPEIKIIKTTSKDNLDGFKNGYVQDAVKDLNLDINETIVLACGMSKMVNDLKKFMIELGLDPKNFRSDVFVQSSSN